MEGNSLREAMREFRAESSALTLPAGYAWPQEGPRWMLAAQLDAERATFEPGFGTLVADTVWLCAWQQQAVDQSVSGQQENTSIARLASFRGMHAYRLSWDAAGRQFFDVRLAQLETGNPTGMIKDVQQNCGPLPKTSRAPRPNAVMGAAQ